ncbi:hypothetical protein [Lentilactobacillus sp. SPB1-3]|uniref:Uncharacterized protein n=1 Tax=Lentilactobacillus terminaliae TaxID=3003483 RepID=A0ACD5DCW9_9LACO|nr:hypothetical protein [Lentilactobacillus sp. SPB1-3]MCZ0978035.1 hypothetical protein [Lentilactobacillus sp. SPB1-3]
MKKKYFGSRDILLDDYNATAIANMVDDTTATADADGQKYLLGGTLLTADKNFLTSNDGSVVLKPTTDATKAQGILRQDYNIAEGAVPASVIVSGTINLARMDDKTKAIYTDDVITALKTSLPKLVIVNRN